MRARVEGRWVVLRAEPRDDAGETSRVPSGSIVTREDGPPGPAGSWARVTLPDGRSGWLKDTASLRPLRDVVLDQRGVDVVDRPDRLGTVIRRLRKGDAFTVVRRVGASDEDRWEILQTSGSRGFVPASTRVADAAVPAPATSSPGLATSWAGANGGRRRVVGGALLLGIGAASEVGGCPAGALVVPAAPWLFPMALSLLGLLLLVLGLRARSSTAPILSAAADQETAGR